MPNHLHGITLSYPAVECRVIEADGTVTEEEYVVLVGCDGSHSTVRHLSGLPFVGSAYDEDFVLADIHVRWPLAMDELHLFFSSGWAFRRFSDE